MDYDECLPVGRKTDRQTDRETGRQDRADGQARWCLVLTDRQCPPADRVIYGRVEMDLHTRVRVQDLGGPWRKDQEG